MARILKSNERFRTKDQIAHDLSVVLRSKLHHGTKYAVLKEAMWVWTEFRGKYDGCEYWTPEACKQYRKTRSVKDLRHEHIVPKKVVMKMLFKLKPVDKGRVRRILDKYLVGVVVTLKEDRLLNQRYASKMPDSFHPKRNSNPWARYQEVLKLTEKDCTIVPQSVAARVPESETEE